MTSAESVDGSAMMTSAVMSSQSVVEQKQYQQLIREAQEMERRNLTLNSELHIQTLITVGEYSVDRQSRRELQYNQSLGNPDASYSGSFNQTQATI
ncbi:hypothetical protein F511_28827 [Dorcoceras hygrometricum]|uniref:Uncharacterized protein n=1 Tax=Dorcoceras hygrometricum TaxID=472368 RepID=A0A2Z7AS99_9LAMI|nr:hypothetical protein F511_28827 [Dorcoceras hygrometricum]